MPRLPRIYVANCLYFITARGNLGEKIFNDEKDHMMYMELLKKYKEQYGFKVFSYSLTPDSLSLLVELKDGEKLSMVMHDINSSYTKYYNSRYVRNGHVFRERFKSVVVEKDAYLCNLVRYIHHGAIRGGYASGLHQYSFDSNLSYLISAQDAALFQGARLGQEKVLDISAEVKEMFTLLIAYPPERGGYAQFMADVSSAELDELAKKLSSNWIMGSEKFLGSVNSELKKRQLQEKARQRIKPAIYLSFSVVTAGIVATVAYFNYMDLVKKIPVSADVEKARRAVPLTAPLHDLDGTEWVVELVPDKGVKVQLPAFDKIVFTKGSVYLSYLLQNGFVSSNYSITTQEDGGLVWETMQTNKDGDTIFWHGEERDGKMKGRFNISRKDGSKDGISFASPGYYKIIKESQQ